MGIESRNLGISTPNFKDFYEFDIENRFQYLYEWFSPETLRKEMTNYKIINKYFQNNQIKYPNEGFVIETTEHGFFKTIDTSLLNRFDLDYAYCSNYQNQKFYNNLSIENSNDGIRRVKILKDQNGEYKIKIIGNEGTTIEGKQHSLNYYPYLNDPKRHSDLLLPIKNFKLNESTNQLPFSTIHEFNQGLGLTKYQMNPFFEYVEIYTLTGYIKDGIIHGDIIPWNIVTIDDNKQPTISISPNPTSNYIYFKYKSIESFNIKILDLAGKEVLNAQDLNNNSLDVSKLEKGTYIIEIQTEKQTYFKKFIKL